LFDRQLRAGGVLAVGNIRIHLPRPFKHARPPGCAGEYIAVEKIESVLEECPLVNQIWVHGNRFESYLVCVAVPSKGKLEVRGASGGVDSWWVGGRAGGRCQAVWLMARWGHALHGQAAALQGRSMNDV
jgi:hypothetical protein